MFIADPPHASSLIIEIVAALLARRVRVQHRRALQRLARGHAGGCGPAVLGPNAAPN